MNLFNIDEKIVRDMLQQAIDEKAEQLAQEKMFWTLNDLIHYTSLSKSKLYETILVDPRCPKFKVGTALRFPAKQMREYLDLWAQEQLEKSRYSYI